MKKLIRILVVIILLFSFCSFSACDNVSLSEYKDIKISALQEYADGKGQGNYSTDNWEIICNFVSGGKTAIALAENKRDVTTAFNNAKTEIDAIQEEDETVDFVLMISVDNDTKYRGENFIVEVSLKNQSGEDISFSYYYSPVCPFIENWKYPSEPMGMPPEPDTIVVKNNEFFSETWSLGAIGYLNPVTYESSSLPIGTHELRFRSLIIVDQNEIEVWSNTIGLMVI